MKMKLDIDKAMKEVQEKSDAEIDKETAHTWTARAIACYKIALKQDSEEELCKWNRKGDDFRHEALEHAALAKDGGKTVGELEKAMDEVEEDEVANLTKTDIQELEILSKSCPRCNSASANKSNPQGRCRSCLNKLASNKKKPGHWQRAQTKADDALRRQDGKNGTASYKSKGRGTRQEIVDKVQSAEKKIGQKLSPDRKDNSRAYAKKNVQMVPESMNRGRHTVDKKKLSAWKKRLKKSNLELEDFMTLLRSKALEQNNEELAKSLSILDIERLLQDIDTPE